MRQGPLPLLLVACTLVAAGCSDPAQIEGAASSDAQAPTSGADPAPAPDVPTLVEGVLTACVAVTPAVAEPGDGDWEGFDVAVLEGVAGQLDLELEVASSSFDAIVSGVALNGGECDVAAGAVVDREELEGAVATSVAYRVVHRLVVTTGTATHVPPEQLTGRVGVEQEGPANDVAPILVAAEVVGYPSQADLAQALAAGAVDAVLVTPSVRVELEAALGADLSLLAAVPSADETVLLLPLGAPDGLTEAVDGALNDLRAEGRLEALQEAWLRD